MMQGLIYVVENKINGRTYIGQTRLNWPTRKIHHIKYPRDYSLIDRAIQKYGEDNFEWTIIDKANNQNMLDALERLHISRYESMSNEWGYNIREGGYKGKLSEQTRQKLSDIWKYRTVSKETCEKISKAKKGKNHHFYGKHFTEEHKKNLSISNTGVKRSEETRRNISKAKTGLKLPKFTKEHRKKISKARMGKYPGVRYMKGRNPEKRCWHTRIRWKQKQVLLGYYEDPISPMIVYSIVWNELYGDGYYEDEALQPIHG